MSALLLALVLSPFARAEEPRPAPPPIKVSGTLFGYWGMVLGEDAANYNEFGLGRVYVRAEGDINEHFGARVTLDADRIKASTLPDGSSLTVDTKTRVFVKHAWLEWKDPAPGLKARFGMIETAIGPYSDELWGHRFITESFSSTALGLSTADFGVSVHGKHADGLVDWTANVVNGEGYSKVEVNSGKMAQARVTVNPLAKNEGLALPVSAFVAYHANPDGDPTLYALGLVDFEQDYVQFVGQYGLRSTGDVSGMGYSATLLPRVPKVVTGIFRYDHFDPDTATDDDATTTLIAGASHHFAKKVAAAATLEQTTAESAPDDPTRAVYLKMLAGF